MTFFLRPSRFFFVVMLSSLAALIFASASVLVPPSASAIESGDIVLQASPADQRINLEPNQVYDGTFTVENVGRKTFSFTLSSRPYQVSSPDYTPDFSTSNSYTVLSNWLSFSADRTTLAPGESATVTYHVDTPADIPGGGQYAAIIVETRDADDTASVRIASQIAVLLYAQISGEQRLEGTLLDLELPNILLGAPFTASVTVENTGNLDFDLTQTLTVTDFLTGRTLVDLSTKNPDGTPVGGVERIILPATTRTSILTWENAPSFGLFRAHQTVSFLDQTYDLERVVFRCPIWLLGLLVVFVLLLIVWLFLRLHRRHQSRPV